MKEELHENEENKRTAWQRKGGKNMENIIMKNRPFKRILSVVLAVLMVITLMPLNGMTVQAADVSVTLTYGNQTSGGFSATGSSGYEGWQSESFKLNDSMTISSNNWRVITKVELKVSRYGSRFKSSQVAGSPGTNEWEYGKPYTLHVTGINNTSLTITNSNSDASGWVSFEEIKIYYHNCSVGSKISGQAATCTSDGWKDYYQCSSCGKIYESATGSNPYANLASWKGSAKGKIPKLGHDFVYSENNNKIEAYCTHAAAGGCGYTEDNKIALTLTADDRDYSGSPYQGADVVDEITPVVGGTSVTKDSIQYYKRGEGTELNSAPTNVGEYTAKVTLGEKTATVDFTIQKASQSATVAMADYSLIGTVSTPTISGQKESPTVTYYYNTTDSNESGTKWENISVNTLAPGIYYMYATLSETDNYNAYTTPTTSFRVSSLPTSIQNGSFETPAIGSWYSIMSETTPSIAWKTTASDGKIEFARPSKNMSAANSAYHTTTTVDGYQFAELCANQVGALYQTVSTFSGDTLKWGFSHKGRSGDDTMELWIGSPADVTAVLNYYKSHNNSVAGIAEDAELLAKYQTISQNSDGTKRSYTDGNTQWVSYTGDYVVPENQTETTFAFVSIAASGNRISYGNLLDNVYFTTQVPVKTQLFEYDATCGGSVAAKVNGIAVSGKEAFVSVGSTIELNPNPEEGYTYNGGFVDGKSYISVNELPLSYTVANSETSKKQITLLFSKDSTIVFDKEGGTYADDAYDLKAVGNNQYYTLQANPTKEGYSFNNWMIAGSNVTLTEGNYIAYETGDDGKTYIRVYNSDTDKTTPLYQCSSELGINLIATYEFTAFPTATVVLDMASGEVDGNVGPLTYELNKFDLSYTDEQSNDKIEYSPLTLPTPTRGVYAFKGWKIGENVYDAGTDIKYALSASNQNGTVTIGTDTQSAITTDTTYTLKAQWETIAMEGITVSGVTKVYDGELSDTITVSGVPAGATVSYGTTEGTYDLSVCPTYKNTGVYTVYFKVSGDGYKDYTGSAKITIVDHTVVIDSAVAPTCTTTGLTEGSHCSVCSKVITAQTTVPALGHDWSGEWTVINQPTDTEEGKKEKTCSREGCGVKKYEVLPKNGSTDDLPANVSGTLEKNAEVAPESPIQEATLDNKKSELLNAPNIFTDGEKQQIAGGTDAKVWLEVTKTDESNIPTVDKTKVEDEAKNIMGDHPTITYFDVDLFKQIAGEAKERLHEPGINIEVTIEIPSDLLNHDRTIVREYKIIRLHDNDVSVLSGEFDEASKEFTFETDKFSTYAIAYSDIQLVTGITLTPDSATLTNKGETVQLTATVTPENAADKNVTWASSNTNVATVDANGKVTAVANGTCTITVTTTDGEKTATSTITVTIPSDDTGDAGNTNDKKNNKPEAPKTGDDSNPALWFSLLFMLLAGLAVFFARNKGTFFWQD